jgi:hypothetical protein
MSTHPYILLLLCRSVSQAVDLIDYVSRGSKRSRLWLVKVLGQITADKAVADAVADRQGVRRSSWKDFVPTWGLTRQAYKLRL